MKRAIYFTLLLVLATAAGSVTRAWAQGTDLGTIAGSVTDSSGAVVGNGSVTITDLGTGAQREAKTNVQGEYRVFGLGSGGYKVTVKAPGMGTAVLTGIQLNGSDVVTADAVLKVASTTEAVEVTSEVPLVNTEDQTISDNISSREVIDLPRDSRNVYSFLYLNRISRSQAWTGLSSLLARKATELTFLWTGSAPTAESSASRRAASLRSKRWAKLTCFRMISARNTLASR